MEMSPVSEREGVLPLVRHKYRINPDIGVLYARSGKPLLRCGTTGYVVAKAEGREKMAHRLIWEFVHGPIPNGYEINHINGIKNDNRISNLELVTHSENVRHAYMTGLNKGANGEASARAKLSALDVQSIPLRRASGESVEQMASHFGVSTDAIYAVLSGRRWGAPKYSVEKVPPESRRIDMSATPAIAPLRIDASGKLFDAIRETHGIKSDSALAIKLGAENATISKVRNGHYGVSAELILKVYDTFGLSIERIRELIKSPANQHHNPQLGEKK